MFNKKQILDLVISDSDIEAALSYLNSRPYTRTKNMPEKWAKQQVIEWIKESLPKDINLGNTFQAGHNIWGHITFLGTEFLGYKSDETKYQVVLSIRSATTDLDDLVKLR